MSHTHTFTDSEGVQRVSENSADCDSPYCPWRVVEDWEKRVELPGTYSGETYAKIQYTRYYNGHQATYVSLNRFRDSGDESGLREMTGHILLFPENVRDLRDLLNSLDLDN